MVVQEGGEGPRLRNEESGPMRLGNGLFSDTACLVHGHVGTFCILKGTPRQATAQIRVEILIVFQNYRQVPRDVFFLSFSKLDV